MDVRGCTYVRRRISRVLEVGNRSYESSAEITNKKQRERYAVGRNTRAPADPLCALRARRERGGQTDRPVPTPTDHLDPELTCGNWDRELRFELRFLG